MTNRNNTRRMRAVKRTSRVSERRAATRQIRAGDYDNLASGGHMRRMDAGRDYDVSSTAPEQPASVSTGWEG